MSKETTEAQAIAAAQVLNADPQAQLLKLVLAKFLDKMIITHGQFAFDAYMVTVIRPLVDSIPLGQEAYLDNLEGNTKNFIEMLVSEEKLIRMEAMATERATQ